MGTTPLVSVVVSTYNRPQVLAFAIRSVLRSDLTDFELIVVGDGCSDDTRTTVEAFDDSRIHYVNLPTNTGSQTAPNNKGVELARGTYLCFLNQDDAYFRDHLSHTVQLMNRTGADISFSPALVLEHSGAASGPPNPSVDRLSLHAAVKNTYDPRVHVIASSWVLRREICAEVGPWLPDAATRVSPSHEWLFRAWGQGRRIIYDPHISVFCIFSGPRRLSFLLPSPEHERAWQWITAGDSASAELLQCLAICQSAAMYESRYRGLRRVAVRLLDLVQHFGIHPVELQWLLRGKGKGAFVARHAAFTREPTVLRPGDVLEAADRRADLVFVSGWHAAKVGGRCPSSAAAEIIFKIDESDRQLTLELAGKALGHRGTVSLLVNGVLHATEGLNGQVQRYKLPLGRGPGIFRITVQTDGVELDGNAGLFLSTMSLST
jgi:GT2 family glycosyltransferase